MLSFGVLLRFVSLAYTLASKCLAIKKNNIMDASLIEYRESIKRHLVSNFYIEFGTRSLKTGRKQLSVTDTLEIKNSKEEKTIM